MGRLKSNYPRDMLEEEVIEPYSTWQWGVLFVAAMISPFLQFWLPTIGRFTSMSRWYAVTDHSLTLIGGLLLLFLPFLFGRGAMARAVLDRVRESTSSGTLWLGGFVAGVTLVPVLFHAVPAMIDGAPAFSALRMYSLEYYPVFATSSSIIHSLGVFFLYLLLLTIPAAKQRFIILVIYMIWSIVISMSGSYVFVQVFPYASEFLPHASSIGMWFFESISNPLMFFTMIWIIDRISFPSFRPFVVMFSMWVLVWLLFRPSHGIVEVASQFGAVLAVVGYALTKCPEAMRLPWKLDESLQSE